jgi:predicted nuclease of predicted toxin-antitoxin system
MLSARHWSSPPRASTTRLSIWAAHGFDVFHVADRGHSRHSDAQIIGLAREQERVLVTLDSQTSIAC